MLCALTTSVAPSVTGRQGEIRPGNGSACLLAQIYALSECGTLRMVNEGKACVKVPLNRRNSR